MFIKTCRLYLVVIATQLIPSTRTDVPNAQIRKYSTCPIPPIIGHLKVKSLEEFFSLERWRYVNGFQGFTPVKMCSLSPLAVPHFPGRREQAKTQARKYSPGGRNIHSLSQAYLSKSQAFARVGRGDLHSLVHYVRDWVCAGRYDCLFYCPLLGCAGYWVKIRPLKTVP